MRDIELELRWDIFWRSVWWWGKMAL